METGIWRPASPAEERVLAALRNQAKVRLPAAYLAHLALSNGGEGDLGVEPGWIAFWPAEQVIEYNDVYCIPECLSGFFGFASNGGGELLAFDARGPEPFPIVRVPFIPMDSKETVRIACSFEEMQALIGKVAADPV